MNKPEPGPLPNEGQTLELVGGKRDGGRWPFWGPVLFVARVNTTWTFEHSDSTIPSVAAPTSDCYVLAWSYDRGCWVYLIDSLAKYAREHGRAT